MYICESINFREDFIFAICIERHICDAKKSRIGHDLPIYSKQRSDFAISQGFYFHETSQFRENKTLAKISEFTVMPQSQITDQPMAP